MKVLTAVDLSNNKRKKDDNNDNGVWTGYEMKTILHTVDVLHIKILTPEAVNVFI